MNKWFECTVEVALYSGGLSRPPGSSEETASFMARLRVIDFDIPPLYFNQLSFRPFKLSSKSEVVL